MKWSESDVCLLGNGIRPLSAHAHPIITNEERKVRKLVEEEKEEKEEKKRRRSGKSQTEDNAQGL